ncbi:LOW QUALITY PROTEIN: arginyl-tRNA synthetase [Geomicrobium sp. JCM 19055]|nr:LOW QUALITY PROTEIN: arginyl-tRNA synthetase [Geomicrobium sp. JCM 19055]
MNLLKEELANVLSLGLSVPISSQLFEYPKQPIHGDLSIPCFTLAQELKMSPHTIALRIQTILSAVTSIDKVDVIGGYANVHFNRTTFADLLFSKKKREDHTSRNRYDYVVTKHCQPFSMGHLRSTVIGESIARLYENQGYTVVRINHIGDWGTQFGKLIAAYKEWGVQEEVEKAPIQELLKLYVRFHKEGDEADGRRWFYELERGNEEALSLWKWFKTVSLSSFQGIYTKLGVAFDSYNGESFYNDKMQDVIEQLESHHLLEQSEGAQVVSLNQEHLPPCLIKKSDGATLYATRDLAAAIYRKQTYQLHVHLYVVGNEQTLHFKQLKAVLRKLGYEWSEQMEHINFGMMRLEGKKMSTRKGSVVYLEDVLSEATTLAEQYMQEKNPISPNRQEVARQVGVGAIIFNDLKNDRKNDIDFSLEDTLRFEGETGPYVQYTHVRTYSLLREKSYTWQDGQTVEDEAWECLIVLSKLEETIARALDTHDPSLVARYVLSLSQAFNRYYSQTHILKDDDHLQNRLSLVDAINVAIKECLHFLVIEAPKKM